MPSVRFQVRNEYGLGAQELYRGVSDEDPKGLLEGVTVAGLVGILRQLGDLAEFAAEVFHDLQEQMMTTAARSHKMVARVRHIEASIPDIEKAVLAQKNHIHFAYTNGSDWHPKIRTHRNHFIYGDLPRFIMDTYEECRDPPSLHLLDKFDKGGPGSCLKRYSDPSYFKKSLPSSGMLTDDKVQRDKKARKRRNLKGQRKRLEQRSRERSHGVSVPDFGRIHFSSPTSYGQSSAAETLSTFTMRSKPDLGDRSFDPKTPDTQSTSLDERTKLGYPDTVSSSRQQEDQERYGLTSSKSKLQTNSDCSTLDEREEGEYIDISGSSLEYSVPKSSSSVSWDEKTEIVKPMHQQPERNSENLGKASDILPPTTNENKLENGVPVLRNIDSILSDPGKTSSSVNNDNQFEEVESDSDSYIDALNTIGSEVETDVELQTKRELSSDRLTNEGTVCETRPVPKMSSSETSESSDVEICSESYSSSNRQVPVNFSNSISSESVNHGHETQVNSVSSAQNVHVDTVSCQSTDCLDVSGGRDFEYASNGPLASGSNIPNSEVPLNIETRMNESAKTSDAPSVKFWTNGVMLGLQPSKPQQFSAINNVNQDYKDGKKDDEGPASSEMVGPESHSNGLNVPIKTPEQTEKTAQSGGGTYIYLDNLSLNDLPPHQLVRKRGNIIQNVDLSHILHNIDQPSLSKSFSNNLDDDTPTKNSAVLVSSMPEFVNKAGGSRSTSCVGDAQACRLTETNNNITRTGDAELQDYDSRQKETKRDVHKTSAEQESPVSSACSSPPLEHMKISAHPIHISNTSILKLKFPREHHFRESNRNIVFPSFQLLPELSASLQGVEYETDDDTFYRSSPDMSDELMSQQSDSTLEQWEFEETPTSAKEPGVYDSRQVSSEEAISSLFETERINDGIYHVSDGTNNWDGFSSFQDGPLLDFPSFDVVDELTNNLRMEAETSPKDHVDLELQYPITVNPLSPPNESTSLPPSDEATPAPPPLPPIEWIAVKPNISVENNEQASISNNVSHLNTLQVPGIPPFKQLKPVPSRYLRTEETTALPLLKLGEEKLNRSTETLETSNGKVMDEREDFSHQVTNKHDQLKLKRAETIQASNGKGPDEREDLLYQIRSKSFNLRRTTTSKPTPDTSLTTNTKVAAMLEKANAIRQAFVGSDEGEDDQSWSDN